MKNFPCLSCVVISLLYWSFLQILYTDNFRHTIIVLTPFEVFQYSNQFAEEEMGVAIRKFQNSLIVTITVSSAFHKIITISREFFQSIMSETLWFDCFEWIGR